MPYSKPAVKPDWIRVTEAAGRLGCDPRTVIAMIKRGELKVRTLRFGSIPRINREDFEREMTKRVSVGVSA